MKLSHGEPLTKEIIKQLTAQYDLGGCLEKQQVICKIFNPYSIGTWYCLNMDPADCNYIWRPSRGASATFTNWK